MSELYLTNSLSRKKEKFVALKPPNVGIYSCGPTVYDFASIGNFRTYTLSDLLVRVLKYMGYSVKYVMNITDVGHLTGDNLGDADVGEDRMEKTAKKEGKTAWGIAEFYTDAFLQDYEKLNLTPPDHLVKATQHIKEQIDLVKKLEEKGLTYKTQDGIYFDTQKYENLTGKKYGELSTMAEIKEGARVEPNPEKKNPRDFALWKFSPSKEKRQMEWDSPWGLGFPGWHIECSAMSMKYLGETFDIHVGGEDLRQTHHPNEIAQSEGATGKQFVRYWVHATHLRVDGKRMGKSLGNVYTVSDIEKKGYEPLALKYLYLTADYRDSLNFTWGSLASAQAALDNLREQVAAAKRQTSRTTLSGEKQKKVDDFIARFDKAISDDLSIPKALAVVWEVVKSNIPSEDKYDLVISFDEVLGLDLRNLPESGEISNNISNLLNERERLRKAKDFSGADKIRKEIEDRGFIIDDTPSGVRIRPKKIR